MACWVAQADLSSALLFYGLQLLCPLLGLLAAYGLAHHRRLAGASGRVLESRMRREAPACSFLLSVALFWSWPEAATPFRRLPGGSWLFNSLVGGGGAAGDRLLWFHLLTSAGLALTGALLARLCAPLVIRKLVRGLPRLRR